MREEEPGSSTESDPLIPFDEGPLDWRDLDYLVVRGEVYDIQKDHFEGKTYLVEVDEIPDGYWKRWSE